MNFLKKLFKFYIDSSIHVALAVCALCLCLEFFISANLGSNLLLFVFFSTVTGYNFVKYAGIAKLHHQSLTTSLKLIQIFSLVCLVGLVVLCFYQSWETLVISTFLGFVTFLYAFPLFPRKTNLRNLKSLKIFFIALVWAGTDVWLPQESFSDLLEFNNLIAFFQVFSLTLALIIPFEIRDLTYDHPDLKTLPQLLGIQKTKILGVLFSSIFLLLGWLIQPEIALLLPTLITSVLISLFIVFAERNQTSFYASFWVEATPIFWLLLIELSQFIY